MASKHRVNTPCMIKGDFSIIPQIVQQFIIEHVRLCEPSGVYLCDGTLQEQDELVHSMLDQALLTKLDKFDNCYLCRTDPADVARVEGKTFIVTPDKFTTVPHVHKGTRGILGQWMSPEQFEKEKMERYPGCMKGRIMYVIPFSMGPIGGPLSKAGIQLTDFNYVVRSMETMTRVSLSVLKVIEETGQYVPCFHSIGCPRPVNKKLISHWPCNPDKILITHFPLERKIMSYGSGYGGNSILGKKCLALRIASWMAKDEGWMAEHMLIMSVTSPEGVEKFVVAAFPSACGKTNMAMLQPTLPGWKVKVVGDDIAWMRFDKEGQLRAINPEAGFFGVAPGTNHQTNPIAMETISKNTIFTNVALTSDGGYFWEGLEDEVDNSLHMETWLNEDWQIGQPGKAAHPNSRFCTPAGQCPVIHPKWEDPQGVPVDAIIFGGRRPEGVPLIVEAFDWSHGVMLGASLKSETTAAAEFKGKTVMHDPMAMRPFMGYNFGDYLQHWLDMEQPGRKMPKICHVNWFRVDDQGHFLWPGFGDNIRVVDWICRRIDGQDIAQPSPIGLVPKPGSVNLTGLNVNWDSLFDLPKKYWQEDIIETKKFLDDQVGEDLPAVIKKQLDDQEARIGQM